MRASLLTCFSAATTATGAILPRSAATITPHESYSSSVGVLGCKINTNRVAYWPNAVDCDNICVEVSHEGRSVYLLRIDQSEGAHDISYDAYNYLTTGQGADVNPQPGGPLDMTYRYVSADKCKDLIHTDGHRLPISAANSMNYMAMCLSQPDSWVAKNHIFYNILDAVCSLGENEECELDWPTANTPKCPHITGNPVPLADQPVYNIRFPTGETVLASTNEIVSDAPQTNGTGESDSKGGIFVQKNSSMLLILGTLLLNAMKAHGG